MYLLPEDTPRFKRAVKENIIEAKYGNFCFFLHLRQGILYSNPSEKWTGRVCNRASCVKAQARNCIWEHTATYRLTDGTTTFQCLQQSKLPCKAAPLWHFNFRIPLLLPHPLLPQNPHQPSHNPPIILPEGARSSRASDTLVPVPSRECQGTILFAVRPPCWAVRAGCGGWENRKPMLRSWHASFLLGVLWHLCVCFAPFPHDFPKAAVKIWGLSFASLLHQGLKTEMPKGSKSRDEWSRGWGPGG